MRSHAPATRGFGLLLACAALFSTFGFPSVVHAQAAPEEVAAAPAEPEAQQPRNLMTMIRDGGLVMIPLLFCSFILTVFAFERAISLRKGRVIPGPFVKRFLHQLSDGQLDREQALGLCEGNDSPVAKVFAAAVRKWGRPAVEVEQAVIDAGERATSELRKYLRVFNGVATVSPLLGLLGTVFGMIRSFHEISVSGAMGRPELLANGISEALVTTATGLMLAIPGLILYWFFISRGDRLVLALDDLGQQVVGVISAEAIQEAAQPKARGRRSSSTAA